MAKGGRGGIAGCCVEPLVSDASAWVFSGLFGVEVDGRLTELQGLADLKSCNGPAILSSLAFLWFIIENIYSYRWALLYNTGRRSNRIYPGFDLGVAAKTQEGNPDESLLLFYKS